MPNYKPRVHVHPSTFEIGETAIIRNLTGNDAHWNGMECIISSLAYEHPKHGSIVINVIIEGDGHWALEPWNLKKIENRYDGYKKVKWADCVWKPKELKYG